MKVLALTNEFPLPLDRGGPVRFLGLARAVAAKHELHLLALRRPSTTEALRKELESLLAGPVEVFARAPAPAARPRARARRWAHALRAGTPPWITAQFSAELEGRAKALAPAADAVVLLDDFAGIYAASLRPFAPVVADKSNVMGWSAATNGSGTLAPVERLRQRLAVRLARRFESDYARHVAAIVVTSEEESRRFEALYGRRPEAVVPSAVDLPSLRSDLSAGAVGWLGTHEYPANVEGLVRFVEQGWQSLGREGYRLLVAGGSPPPEVRALERYPGVEVLGYVEPLEGFLAHLRAAVVPLWQGAGVKLKTLTFMGAAVPVAATPVAVEGVAAEHGRNCLISDDPAGLSGALRTLLTDVDLGRRLGAEARRLVSERYTWDTVGLRFVEAVERAVNARR